MAYLRLALIGVASAAVASCEYVSALFEKDFPIDKVDDAYAARDSCLKWTVVMTDEGDADPAEVAARVASSCHMETTALARATDPHGNPIVAAKIKADSEFRAAGYVTRSREAASAIVQKR